ncbi:hypothetical protein CLCR_05848 [Cladophialophora carrionii]|uniref:SET domain-containing protein n=1 Tax=Cladophialophora carrionii TaxID=86049 RepID=A0A1C1C7R2_9EURO|nr:hypothetical protein CLCR_05848 [Cladophialophora carrionii]
MKFELVSFGVVSLVVSLVACTEPLVPAEQGVISRSSLSSEDSVEAGSRRATRSSHSSTQEISGSYFPWTHKPVCTEYLDGIGDQLCVYTNATFSNGRGISIFTTPRIAQEFAALPPFQDPESLSSRGINAEPDVPTQPWYTALIRGKGMGMLAARPLQRGDLITAYTPYLLAHMENVLSTHDREYYLRLAVDQLPPASRNIYLGLAKMYNDPSVVAQDVVKANAFEIQIGGLMHLAVFPESSRFNHACAPNAQYFLSSDLLTHYVHAVRPVDEDEELTISYAPPLRLRADRQQYLETTFQFTCTCPRCSPESLFGGHKHRTVEDSDRATQDIIALQWALAQWTANSTASVKKAEMLVRLYKEEGLDAFLDDAYGHAALMYSSVGSARGAKKYATLAAEASWLKYGFESVGQDKVREWEAIARDPTRHGSWRSRRKTEL